MIYEAHTLGEFLRKVAIDYLRYGYYRYLLRVIPEKMEVHSIDRKVIADYEITVCRMTRFRRKKAGRANVAYVRWGRRFVLLATEGMHEEFEKRRFLDIRENPLYVNGYSIGIHAGKPCVMIEPTRYQLIRSHLHAIALFNEARVTEYLRNISPFSFPGIVRQKRRLLHEVNRRRKRAGLSTIKIEVRFTKKDASAPKIAAY
ncbi:hypothetical protein NIES37_44740 [Tolypothrix tenuis PCC 7101]|uniref:Uncharacterized protein n=2 Tax=Tolypothrix TaxID=111782 RepID=A0A1Z4N499_9CYAN|nr:hypothetical protein NIES37_44740 [Tolypothrix tenuis PCC 7101]BAZ75596.1 hypothetical protein NIES50_41840 [Aulosira laxa NIES-50]